MQLPKEKKNQHYVAQVYLKSWATPEGQIFCRRDGKIFPTATRNVGSQKLFYKNQPLTKLDLTFIETFFTSRASKDLQAQHRKFLNMLSLPFTIADALKEIKNNEELAAIHSLWESNGVEEFHTVIESDSTRFLQDLRDGNAAFYEDHSARGEFLFFLSLQYMRTKRLKQATLKSFSDRKDLHDTMEKVWSAVSVLLAMNVGVAMTRENSRLVFIENHSNVPFITGDQPVVNLLAGELEKDPNFSKVELYYPLSPTQAILVTDLHDRERRIICSQDNEAIRYNAAIRENSHEQIYSHCAEVLKYQS